MKARITIECEKNPVHEHLVDIGSEKRLTSTRAARLLAAAVPRFRRRKGRFARYAGIEVLPVMEKVAQGWRAWRLASDANEPSGYEPPLKARAGAANSARNPYSDRRHGTWEFAIVHSTLVDVTEMPSNSVETNDLPLTPQIVAPFEL